MSAAPVLPPHERALARWPRDAGVPPPPAGQDAADWPRVSVITPSYNQAAFLEDTIRSVLLQGYPNLEYIVMDGGSSDGSVDIIRKYAPWIAHWESAPDKGQSDAINRGWQRATGDIVAWLNADDLYCPDAIRNAAACFRANPDAAMVYGAADVIDEHGERCGVMIVPDRFRILEMIRSFNNIVPSVTAFVRRGTIAAVGALRTDLHFTMDFEFALRIGLHGAVVRDAGIRSRVRVHSAAKSSGSGVEGLKEMHDAVLQVKRATRDPAVRQACEEGLALAATRLSLASAAGGDYPAALGWRARSVLRALRHVNRKAMLALLLPGRLFPSVRKHRADYAEGGVNVVWEVPPPPRDPQGRAA